MITDTIIEFHDVTINTAQGTPIVSSISFSIRSGQKVLLFGPSGSGKSTLILAILGCIRPVSGSIYYRGSLISAETMKSLRREISYVPQTPIPEVSTVRDALLLPYTFKANRKSAPEENQLREILQKSGFDYHFLERKTDKLSGGEKQRIALVRALLLNKDILIVDEPASSLDKDNERNVLRMLLDNLKTVIAVSHNPDWQQSFDMCINLTNKQCDITCKSKM